MSTKASIKYKDADADGPGYHLYTDMWDDDDSVCLYLDGVQIEELFTYKCTGGASVTVKLPRSTAEELGLVQKEMT